jgi:hypothetical protein
LTSHNSQVSRQNPFLSLTGVVILVDKSTQDVDPFDPFNLRHVGRHRLAVYDGHAQVDAPMGAGGCGVQILSQGRDLGIVEVCPMRAC